MAVLSRSQLKIVEMKPLLFKMTFAAVVKVLALASVQMPEEWWPMPNGYWFHQSCIHQHTDPFDVVVLESGYSIVVCAFWIY